MRTVAGPKRDPLERARRLAIMVLSFAILPGALLLSVGILVLVFARQGHDILFGTLVLCLTLALVAAFVASFLYVRSATSYARLQSEFVNKVSHDLRTPLTSIQLFVEALQRGSMRDPDAAGECLAGISRETNRLARMVERLLRWAKMEAGKQSYEPEMIRPRELIEDALLALQPQIEMHRAVGTLEVETSIDEDAGTLLVDREALTETLINLLQNALVHTGSDKRIRVSCARRGQQIELAVADNGPGIPAEDQRLVFTRFYRGSQASPNVGGTGLGLAIARHVVRSHHGKILLQSTPGHGATFRILLPAGTARTP